jgi:lysine biosynthesis protein LysW
MAHCPECEAVVEVDADEVEEGQLVNCPECGAELEVVNTNPIELDLAEDEDMEEEDDADSDEDLDDEEDDENQDE